MMLQVVIILQMSLEAPMIVILTGLEVSFVFQENTYSIGISCDRHL